MKDTVHSSRSVPLTIGALYLIAAFVQIWYWWGYLIVPHNDFLLSLVRMLVSGRFGDMVMGAIGLFYQTLFAWCVLSVLWIGLRIIRLSLDPGVTVRIMSWHAKPLLKAFASLCVVLICALMGFTFQSVSDDGPVHGRTHDRTDGKLQPFRCNELSGTPLERRIRQRAGCSSNRPSLFLSLSF